MMNDTGRIRALNPNVGSCDVFGICGGEMTVTAFIQGKTRRAVTQFSIHATSATNVSSRARSGPDAGGSFKFTDCGIFQKSSGVK